MFCDVSWGRARQEPPQLSTQLEPQLPALRGLNSHIHPNADALPNPCKFANPGNGQTASSSRNWQREEGDSPLSWGGFTLQRQLPSSSLQLPSMAQRGQATCPRHHPCGSVPADVSACSFAAKSRSNLCYTLRERATFLSPAQLQLTLRTFKSF